MQHLHGGVANPQCYDVYARICVCIYIYVYIYIFLKIYILFYVLFAHIHDARAQAHTLLQVGMVNASYRGGCPLS